MSSMFSCDQCNYQANRKYSITIHNQKKHQFLKFPCQECSLKFSQKNSLQRHVESKHDGVVYQCEYCNHGQLDRNGI